MKSIKKILLLVGGLLFYYSNAQEIQPINKEMLFPWCMVAYDTPERTPDERILLLKELGFKKYAYDWRERHINDTQYELQLAMENNIEIVSVWLWLNAKRDSIGKLSSSNEKLFEIVKNLNLKTTFWVSLSANFFKNLTDEEALNYSIEMISFISKKAKNIGCSIALYNHSGWFGNPENEIKIINALSNEHLTLVYNFHHGKNHIDNFEEMAKSITPYLSAVNLNGMLKEGDKIYPLGQGSYEKEMIFQLQENGFNGPWGILGHIENIDVQIILKQNLKGLKTLQQ